MLEDISQDDTILVNSSINNNFETIRHVPENYMVWQGPESGFGLDYMDFATTEDFSDYLFVNYSWFDFFNDTIAVPAVRDSIVFDCPVTTINYSGASSSSSDNSITACLLYTSPSPRDQRGSRMPSSA